MIKTMVKNASDAMALAALLPRAALSAATAMPARNVAAMRPVSKTDICRGGTIVASSDNSRNPD